MTDISHILAELDRDFPDLRYINLIKTGKEAAVHLVANADQYFALKIYKKEIKFASRKDYFNSSEIKDRREGRAIKNNSRFGKQTMLSVWAQREYAALRDLAERGAAVPAVWHVGSNFLLMEFIGIGSQPAPQLYHQRFSDAEAAYCFAEVTDSIELFWQAGYVHGDLSAYNILLHEGHSVIIDLPQVVKISQTAEAPAKLLRDIDNIANYFSKYHIPDAPQRLAELRELAYGYFG